MLRYWNLKAVRVGSVKYKVVVGRKWNNPEVYTQLCDEKIELAISIENFVLALAAEIKSPAFILTKAGLAHELSAAIPKVLSEVKKSSVEVV